MDSILNVLKDNPWWIVGGVLIGVFLLRGNNSAPQSDNGSIALASQEIASNTNVALAGIQVDREGIAASQNIAAIQARRDISLGAQQFAIANKSLNTQTALAGMEQTNVLASMTNQLTDNMFTTLAGVKLAQKDMDNQRLGMTINQNLMIRDQDLQRDISMGQQSNDRFLGERGMFNADNADIRNTNLAIQSLVTNFQATIANLGLQRDTLPFEERMNQAQINGMTQLGHQQYKGIKVQAKAGMWGSLFSGLSGLAGDAMAMYGGGRGM